MLEIVSAFSAERISLTHLSRFRGSKLEIIFAVFSELNFVNVLFLYIRAMEACMKVIVNGEPADIRDGITVAELLEDYQIGRDRVAVEIGLEIVSKALYTTHAIQEGDRVEIVQFVGGG